MPQQQFTNRHNRTVSTAPKKSQATSASLLQTQRAKYILVALPILLLAMTFLNGNGAEAETKNSSAKQASVVQSQPDKPAALAKPKISYKPFPLLDESKLTPVQKRIVATARSEYAKRPTGYDKSVMTYTEGSREPWCANFISWVRDEAGIPFEHPTTGYWRIPGVSTLRDYYRQHQAYFAADEYTPKLGDVAFYEGDTADSNSSEHVALVLGIEGDKLITIGGNETDDAILQIRYSKLAVGERGLVAFGRTSVQ